MPLSPLRVAVIGQGYVGLPLSLSAVASGHVVYGVEAAPDRLKSLRHGRSYVDDVTDDEIAAALTTERLVFVPNVEPLRAMDVVAITVPTPLGEDGTPDLRSVLSSLDGLRDALHEGSTVILESTTYPGTTEEVIAPILEQVTGGRIGHSIHLGFSPERIDPGNQMFTAQTTPKLVSGVTDACLDRVRAFYASLGILTVDVTGTREAELAKLIENTFRLVNIALVNEIAEYAHIRGIDARAAIRAASTKPFGFMAFEPGPGVGGHCIPIDPNYLDWDARASAGVQLGVVRSAALAAARRPEFVARTIVDLLGGDEACRDMTIVVIGVSYKADIADSRESPALKVVEVLTGMGCRVLVYDPVMGDTRIGALTVHGSLTDEQLSSVRAGVVITHHARNDYAMFTDRNIELIDTRDCLGALASVLI